MPITTLTITDLTRMGGNRVCVAGITDDGKTIRPELSNSLPITEDWLFAGSQVIKPFARVRFNILNYCPDPPHTEDHIIRHDYKVVDDDLNIDQRLELLEETSNESVVEIFETKIFYEENRGYFFPHGQGSRSLGTIHPKRIFGFTHRYYEESGKFDYRVTFVDQDDVTYRLGITDLALRYYVDFLRMHEKLPFIEINRFFNEMLKADVYIRVGLARPTDPRHSGFCHLQLNGIYTFPDYLDGRCFADFRPDVN